ncbi:MAG: EFR1 family ferrodoxin [Oscillospiraceae bacterium]|nr:EFR1 family ferrodoxin [Oscillospiraceae bacterium]
MTGIYFSGTGNTKFCAEKFLEHFDNPKIFSIEDSSAVPAISENSDIVFAYPIYYSNMPKIVRDFIERNSTLWQGKNIYIIATMGLFSGDGSGVSARLFKKFGANIIGGLHVKMPDCIGDVKALKKPYEKNLEIIKSAVQKIKKAAEDYKNKKPSQEGLNFMYHMAGLFGQRLYFYSKTKNYTASPNIKHSVCTGCGKCEKLCPMKNIRISGGKAVSGNMCTLCYRCFSSCPQKAITILGSKVLEQHRMENYKDNI